MVNWLGRQAQNFIKLDDTVLDVGCGIMQGSDDLQCKSVLGVDIWRPYLEKIKHLWPVINLDISKDLDKFLDSSFDVTISLDVLEHLEEKHLDYVLSNMARICRKYSVIFTPKIFQTNKQQIEDSWGLGKCEYQKHLSLVTRDKMMQHKFIPLWEGSEEVGIMAIYTKPQIN